MRRLGDTKLFALTCTFLLMAPAGLIVAATDDQRNINMILGDVQNVEVKGLTRISVTDPDIADIADAKENEVSLVARKMGHTILFVWDREGKKTFAVNVATDDLAKLKSRISVLLMDAGITTVNVDANYVEGKVIISGNVNKDQKTRLEKVLAPFEDQVINLSKEDEALELIQIDMQIAEVTASFDRNIGMTWSGDANQGDLKFTYQETLPSVKGANDWLKLGQFNRTNPIVNTINLLESQGKARTLSRPRILVTSGKEATVNVGGEIPIQSTTSNSGGGSVQSNVTFKQYGLTVTVTPTIKESKIDVTLNLQVSDIDTSTPIKSTSGNNVAYKTRTAQTQLMLDDRQTVVLAGLIRFTDSNQRQSVPFLNKIPVLGILFDHNSKQAPDEAKELVITLTPVIMRHKKIAVDQIKIPNKELNDFIDDTEKLNQYQHEPVDPSPTSPADSTLNDQRRDQVVMPVATKPGIKNETPQKTIEVVADLKKVGGQQSITTIQRYMQDIQDKISRNISYPYEALKNKWQGTVKLKLHILKDGTLVSANVVQSSDKQVFDQDAVNAARIAAPYAPFSKDMQASDINVTIPIIYQAK